MGVSSDCQVEVLTLYCHQRGRRFPCYFCVQMGGLAPQRVFCTQHGGGGRPWHLGNGRSPDSPPGLFSDTTSAGSGEGEENLITAI